LPSSEQKTTHYLRDRIPFVFLIDFAGTDRQAYTFEEAAEAGIYFKVRGTGNEPASWGEWAGQGPVELHPQPVSESVYRQAFETVQRELRGGNSFLLNLTFASELKASLSLPDLYRMARAPYKLLYRDEFVVFSPESYLRIADGRVHTYPMKGTIRNEHPDSARELLDNPKEQYEHNTIVDLLRNDLSMIAREVEVVRFRYVEKIRKGREEWLQTSSEIRGRLPDDWQDSFAGLFLKTLPAGSISGAPKEKTVQIIRGVETSDRGFYTGVFGVFDGRSIDSGVLIRYIEKREGRFYFRSGGGITHLSVLEEEYRELIDKIYVPTL